MPFPLKSAGEERIRRKYRSLSGEVTMLTGPLENKIAYIVGLRCDGNENDEAKYKINFEMDGKEYIYRCTKKAFVPGVEDKGIFETRVQRRWYLGVPYTELQWEYYGLNKIRQWDNAKRCRLRFDKKTCRNESIDFFVRNYGGDLWNPPIEWNEAHEPKRGTGWDSRNNPRTLHARFNPRKLTPTPLFQMFTFSSAT